MTKIKAHLKGALLLQKRNALGTKSGILSISSSENIYTKHHRVLPIQFEKTSSIFDSSAKKNLLKNTNCFRSSCMSAAHMTVCNYKVLFMTRRHKI